MDRYGSNYVADNNTYSRCCPNINILQKLCQSQPNIFPQPSCNYWPLSTGVRRFVPPPIPTQEQLLQQQQWVHCLQLQAQAARQQQRFVADGQCGGGCRTVRDSGNNPIETVSPYAKRTKSTSRNNNTTFCRSAPGDRDRNTQTMTPFAPSTVAAARPRNANKMVINTIKPSLIPRPTDGEWLPVKRASRSNTCKLRRNSTTQTQTPTQTAKRSVNKGSSYAQNVDSNQNLFPSDNYDNNDYYEECYPASTNTKTVRTAAKEINTEGSCEGGKTLNFSSSERVKGTTPLDFCGADLSGVGQVAGAQKLLLHAQKLMLDAANKLMCANEERCIDAEESQSQNQNQILGQKPPNNDNFCDTQNQKPQNIGSTNGQERVGQYNGSLVNGALCMYTGPGSRSNVNQWNSLPENDDMMQTRAFARANRRGNNVDQIKTTSTNDEIQCKRQSTATSRSALKPLKASKSFASFKRTTVIAVNANLNQNEGSVTQAGGVSTPAPRCKNFVTTACDAFDPGSTCIPDNFLQPSGQSISPGGLNNFFQCPAVESSLNNNSNNFFPRGKTTRATDNTPNSNSVIIPGTNATPQQFQSQGTQAETCNINNCFGMAQPQQQQTGQSRYIPFQGTLPNLNSVTVHQPLCGECASEVCSSNNNIPMDRRNHGNFAFQNNNMGFPYKVGFGMPNNNGNGIPFQQNNMGNFVPNNTLQNLAQNVVTPFGFIGQQSAQFRGFLSGINTNNGSTGQVSPNRQLVPVLIDPTSPCMEVFNRCQKEYLSQQNLRINNINDNNKRQEHPYATK